MGDLFFPQLTSGTLAQYPLTKARFERTVKNALPDGTLILYPDVAASRYVWQLQYSALSHDDLTALFSFFEECQGRLHGFTFIDPTENMLTNSMDLTLSPWHMSSSIDIAKNTPDPTGSFAAFSLTNNGQTDAEIAQSLSVPASFQYCFSVYASSESSLTLKMVRRGPSVERTSSFLIGQQWQRLTSEGRIPDGGSNFTVALSLAPGQQVSLFAPQLEPQIAPSRYRPTGSSGGVHANAHWAVDELLVSADAPNLFSTALAIEASV